MNPHEALRLVMAETDRYYKERGIFQDRFGFGEKRERKAARPLFYSIFLTTDGPNLAVWHD